MRELEREGSVPRSSSVDPRSETSRRRLLASKTSRRRFLGLLGGGAAASVGASGLAGAHGNGTPVVAMASNYFDPVGLSVEPGTTVRFEIEAGTHSATAYEDRIPDGATPFDSGTFSEGGFERTFEVPGTYDYYCIPHRGAGMVGRIVVGDPGGPAEESPIPDGAVPESTRIVEQGAVAADAVDGDGGPTGRGMMGHGPGMMDGGGPGWMMLVPVGFLTTVLGLVGGVAYWAARRGAAGSAGDESAMAALREQYARGEIDEEEFERRRDRLYDREQTGR